MTKEQKSLTYSRHYTYIYNDLNRKYFHGLCPPLEVYFRNMPPEKKEARFGYTAICKHTVLYIVLNSRLKTWGDTLVLTLLHEMIHARFPNTKDHGKKFKEERRRLILEGAFDDLI